MHEERTRYLGSYEREIHHRRASPAANLDLEKTLHRHTLPGGTIYTRTISPSGNLSSAKLTSVLSDHLGSTDVLLVSAWNGSGWASPLIERQAFNSWGERANAQTWENARNSPADPYRTSVSGGNAAPHKLIREILKADAYFAHPYHSWERGLNENTYGLVRPYFPKGSNFSKVTASEVTELESKLNRRPRTCLDDFTPYEIFNRLPPIALAA